MAYIDNLAFLLFSISFGGFLLLYTISSMYLVYRNKKKDYIDHLEGASVPMMLVGGYLVIAGFVGQVAWPLPGSYNILFFDPLVAFGLVLLSFAIAIRYKVNLEYAGFFGLLVGVTTLIYGYQGYNIGLTQEPLALLALYLFYGVAGVFSYPVALIADRLPGLQKNPWIGWHITLVIFWLALFAASLLSGYIGMTAIAGHLLTTP
jgi:putative membrane protein